MSARPARSAAGQLALELPLELPPIALAPEWKDQQRLWGHAFHPMCSYLASFPAALTHAFIARYSRPGDVVLDPFSGPWHDAAAGLRRGPDRGRQRPQPVRPPADRGQGRAGDPGAGQRPGSPSSGWPGTRTRPAGLRSVHWSRRIPPARRPSCPRQAPAPARTTASRRVPVEVALAFHPRTLGQLLFVRTALRLDDRTDRFLAAALTGILHGKSASYLSELMPNTFSMAPRYVRDFAARTAFASPERDVFDGLSKKLDRLFRQAPPSIEGIALLGDARDVAPRARAALRARGRADRARLVVTSPPYLRVVKYGYYNWLRTWFLGLRRARDRRDPRRRPPPRAVSPVPARCPRRPAAGPRRRRRRRPGHRRRRDRPRPRRSAAASGSPSAPGSPPPSPRATAWRASRSTTSPPVKKMTKLWGDEAGRATKTDRILVLGATEAGRRRALAGAPLDVDWTWPPRGLRSL